MPEQQLSRSTDNQHFPIVTTELLEKLEKLFPELSPSLKEDHRQMDARSGEARVVRLLRRKHTEQNNVHVEEAESS